MPCPVFVCSSDNFFFSNISNFNQKKIGKKKQANSPLFMSYIVRSTNDAGEDVLRMRNAGGGGDGADADDAFHRLYQAEVQEKGFEHSGLTEVVLPQPYSTARAGAVVFQVFQPGTSKPGCWEVGAVVHAGIAAAVVGVTKEEDEQNGDGGGGSSGSRRDPRCRDRAKCMVFGFEGGGCNVDSGALYVAAASSSSSSRYPFFFLPFESCHSPFDRVNTTWHIQEIKLYLGH